MKFAIVILCAVIFLLLTGVLPVGKGLEATAVYTSPMMILLLALLSASGVWCCIKRKFSAKQIGFYLVHLGVVVLLAGAFIGYVVGTKGTLQISLKPQVPLNQMLDVNGKAVRFGFEVAASDFKVEFYPPMYHFYRQIPPERMQVGQMPFEQVAEFDLTGKEELDLGSLGPFKVSNLWNEARAEWAQRRMLESGSFLHRASQTPSHFGVNLLVDDGGEQSILPISINHPAGYKGWRFYLMSYDQTNRSFVVLSARRDPGRAAAIAGIWILITGTFVLCFRRTGGAK